MLFAFLNPELTISVCSFLKKKPVAANCEPQAYPRITPIGTGMARTQPNSDAMRKVIDFPRQGSRAGHMHDALRIERVGLHRGIGRIDEADTIGHERVAIEIRFERICCHRPHPLLVLLHRHALGTLARQEYFFGIRSAEPEDHTVV